jgi:hypothetical protein
MHFSDLHAPGPPTFVFSHWPAGGPLLVGVWGGPEPDLLLVKCFYNCYFTREGGGRVGAGGGGLGGAARSTPDLTLLQLNIKETVLCIQGDSTARHQITKLRL